MQRVMLRKRIHVFVAKALFADETHSFCAHAVSSKRLNSISQGDQLTAYFVSVAVRKKIARCRSAGR